MQPYQYCPQCASPLFDIALMEDGGEKVRRRCAACDWTHWNNPTPVLAAVIELEDQGGKLLIARNAAWKEGMFGLVTGFMEAGESPEGGIEREIGEETQLRVSGLKLLGVYDFQRMNQVIIAYHARASGPIRLSPELVEYKMVPPEEIKCWRAGTGLALAEFLRSRGFEPQWRD